ncbi:Transposase and inactivated derivatives, IS30 family [Noviherbaspirillum humi]|uniref:Transposase and inactivated derivatives, IS30 family n=1 Tax=Noviherbaspirillum humi TaxID=1688639 RepID=A0A239FBI5_9BURK|nr:IS30 family transposase [Noviherbaspirillum humi]SNS54286.1 Transposase and inactivated derivatives, IS30 family [Noviherbaspirillum humi]
MIISRELRRNCGQRGYRPAQAQQQSLARRCINNGKRISEGARAIVDIKLGQLWSPEQVFGYLRVNGMPSVSLERLYQHIYADQRAGGSLHKGLRSQKQRNKRYGQRDRRGAIAHAVSIEQRPGRVDRRERYGDWEVDLVIGAAQQQALVTLNERKTAQAVSDTMIGLLTPFVDCVHTVTYDDGKEFAQHARIAKDLDAQFFLAHPHCSWERGANENMNGLLRQFFPKKMAFADITDNDIALAMYSLNHRPRKCLGFKTPYEVFMSQLQSCY